MMEKLWVLITGGLLSLSLTAVFFWVPPAHGLGWDFKIFFFHVPAAWLMLISAALSGGGRCRNLGHRERRDPLFSRRHPGVRFRADGDDLRPCLGLARLGRSLGLGASAHHLAGLLAHLCRLHSSLSVWWKIAKGPPAGAQYFGSPQRPAGLCFGGFLGRRPPPPHRRGACARGALRRHLGALCFDHDLSLGPATSRDGAAKHPL